MVAYKIYICQLTVLASVNISSLFVNVYKDALVVWDDAATFNADDNGVVLVFAAVVFVVVVVGEVEKAVTTTVLVRKQAVAAGTNFMMMMTVNERKRVRLKFCGEGQTRVRGSTDYECRLLRLS